MKQKFKALNGLRFVAAIAVVTFHYGSQVSGFSYLPPALRNLVACGPAALGFFFVLSGFVLSHGYVKSPERALHLHSRDFWVSRFARLYPAYLLAFLLFLPLAFQKYILHPAGSYQQGHTTFILGGLLSISLLQAWTSLSQVWNGPGWSLSVEGFFYLIFPFVLPALLFLKSRLRLWLCVFLSLIPPGFAFAVLIGIVDRSRWEAIGRNNPILWLPLFLVGILISNYLPDFEQLPVRRLGWISDCCSICVLLCCCLCPREYQNLLITGGLTPLLTLLILCYTQESGFCARFLSSPILDSLGGISYIIYILQAPAWHYYSALTNFALHKPISSHTASLAQFLLFIPVLTIASFLVQRFIEEPARQSIMRGWKDWRADRLAAAAANESVGVSTLR